MTTPTLVIGDDFVCEVTLQVDGSAHAVSGTVMAAVVSADHGRLLLDPVAQVPTSAGADWSAGIVSVIFTSGQTESIAQTGPALIEVQVDAGTKSTWFAPLNVVLGHIA